MKISVVVASCRSAALANATITSLRRECEELGAELILARRTLPEEMTSSEVFPDCIVIPCPAEATIPQLRGAGLAAATGERVLLTEDNCVARPDWVRRLAEGFDAGADVVGGTMGNAHANRAIDAAAYLAEYGHFGPMRQAPGVGASPMLTGANVAYHRRVCADAAVWALAGDWEGVIHHRLAARGARFSLIPDAVVEQNLHYQFGAFCADRYQHALEYARVRRKGWGIGKRLAMAGATPLLPALLTWRAWRNAGRSNPGGFMKALPCTVGFLSAWAMGEAAGYLGVSST